MPSEFVENNIAKISGVVEDEPSLSYSIYGEGFYAFSVRIKRTSGSFDVIPAVVSDRLVDEKYILPGRFIYIEGQFRSHNVQGETRSQLKLMVFARKVVLFDEKGEPVEFANSFADESGDYYNAAAGGAAEREDPLLSIVPDMNEIYLDGFICKQPVFRITPLKREISDILLAVNRPYNKSDYIPCICWGRNARFCGKRSVGEHVKIRGRIQSRAYVKRLPDGTEENRVAFEVSISGIEVEA
ncbi:MAG: single-stranded DNA-binding protein [Clostridia bacterium]|nr:single-stranded DNA-binding protein [Clostridia bacterium]MCR5693967.1 single-stranded DNA-binding protein [Clostridia bacterium]